VKQNSGGGRTTVYEQETRGPVQIRENGMSTFEQAFEPPKPFRVLAQMAAVPQRREVNY